MPGLSAHHQVYTYKSCNPELAAANQVAYPKRHTCICCCNAANSITRNKEALHPWSHPNSTSVTALPAIECQFCVYTTKRCPGKCDRPRQCVPIA